MKTLKVDDKIHADLTVVLGQLIRKTGKILTYNDALRELADKSVPIPPEMSRKIEDFIEENPQLGFSSKEEFVRDAILFQIEWLTGKQRQPSNQEKSKLKQK